MTAFLSFLLNWSLCERKPKVTTVGVATEKMALQHHRDSNGRSPTKNTFVHKCTTQIQL